MKTKSYRGKRTEENAGERRAQKQCVDRLVVKETLQRPEDAIAAMNGLKGNTLNWTAETEYVKVVIRCMMP